LGRGSTHPTLPHFVHLKCAQMSYQSQSGKRSSGTLALCQQRGPVAGPTQNTRIVLKPLAWAVEGLPFDQ